MSSWNHHHQKQQQLDLDVVKHITAVWLSTFLNRNRISCCSMIRGKINGKNIWLGTKNIQGHTCSCSIFGATFFKFRIRVISYESYYHKHLDFFLLFLFFVIIYQIGYKTKLGYNDHCYNEITAIMNESKAKFWS